MAKFSGVVGFGHAEETAPGVWQDVIVEKVYYGDVLRATRQTDQGQKVNNDLSVSNPISIVADPYANDNFFAMKYVMWRGTRWEITNIREEYPRLILQLGGKYNGITPRTP